jgi:DNA-binding NtrC family response regulator/tetratricopeptide (TPR) repeat protein
MAASSPPPEELLVSGRYRIVRKLGAGTLGTVYLALDEAEDRQVALKIIGADRLKPGELEELQKEFQAIAGLRHPRIAAAYDFGYTDEGRLPYYTREFVEGRPVLPGPPERPIAAREFLRPVLDLLDALHYLHAHGILHLDIHPGNLIEGDDRERGSVLIDFGLAAAAPASSSPGSDPSRAPEILAERPAGPAADIHAAGRLLLYRLTGSFEGDARLPREIPGWGPRVTLGLERAIAKATHPDPESRFRSAAEFREALSLILDGSREAPGFVEPGDLTVGREGELAAIGEAIAGALKGGARALWIHGSPGAGKSRLLVEARWQAQLQGLAVAEVRFHRSAVGGPQLLGALAGRRKGGAVWLQAMAVEHGGSTAERARRTARAYFDSGGPALVLLLDDLEEADRESGILAEALIAEAAGRKVPGRGIAVITASSTGPPPGLSFPGGRASVRRLVPLRSSSARELLAKLVRPLEVPAPAIERLARAAGGSPLRLRRIARSLHERWGKSGAVPGDVEPPADLGEDAAPFPARIPRADPAGRAVLEALAALERPARLEEIRAATGLLPADIRKALKRLSLDEIVAGSRTGGPRLFSIVSARAGKEVLSRMPASRLRALHSRLAAFLRGKRDPGPGAIEGLARHVLLGGSRAAGREAVRKAVALLRGKGCIGGALRLLVEASARERDRARRIRMAEEISSLHEEAGDHAEGIAVLDPIRRGALGPLDRKAALRIRRRLGVHHHRGGSIEKALGLFREVRAKADPAADVEELILVESELAELHTLRGSYDEAEAACRRGLDLLRKQGGIDPSFHRRMQMVLRGSRGLLELRRLHLESAREDLEAAAALARSLGTAATRALILNNLGIACNQMNDFPRARRRYLEARRLLETSGKHREMILIASNLATICAKTGDAAAARAHLGEAAGLAARFPGKRLEFIVEMARGMVTHFLGDPVEAAEAFERALPLAEGLGDRQSLLFGRAYLAEDLILCGRYGEALETLRSGLDEARGSGIPAVARMLAARLFLLESLLGRKKASEAALAALDEAPPSESLLLDAWNDLIMAGGHLAAGAAERSAPHLESALRSFRRLGIPAGCRLVRAGLLYLALTTGGGRCREILKDLRSLREDSHRLLSVLEPLARAEAAYFLGEGENCEREIAEASGAIVGLPFLELDWRIEFVRARLAEREGDREGARRGLHRSLHTRDLLARSLPAPLRAAFLAGTRFRPLADLAGRLERSQSTPAVRTAGSSRGFQGMIGGSPAMLGVFERIGRLADGEVPVVILGETGTGKELAAKAIHRTSPRRRGPFLALGCASLPAELFESELFGHEAGAFTGAERSRPGLLETISGGTLLLDEVDALTPSTQAKLLRAIDAGVVRPLGGLETRPIDVRFLASSSADLPALVTSGGFRADLYYRLAGAEIRLPPLRARKEDLLPLARHFIAQHAGRHGRAAPRLTEGAQRLLAWYDWPGNVRQLETVLLRALLASSPGGSLDEAAVRGSLPEEASRGLFAPDLVAGRDLGKLRDELERVYLARLFRDTRGDFPKMMEVLGVTQATLYRWFKRLDLDPGSLRRGLS